MKTFPTLYKRNVNGSIQQWTITAYGSGDNGVIQTVYGQVGGALMDTQDVIKEGKNVGRRNETSPAQQALLEAEARWTKSLKKGYVQDIEEARAGIRDAIITGGVDPMLAQSYSKHAAKIVYPAYAQPKYDGIRCIATIVDGKCSLWTRTRKPITGVPHIVAALETRFRGRTFTFDGELYSHAFKNDFEKIVSFVRQQDPAPGHEVVEFHIYDIVMKDADFSYRAILLADLLPMNAGCLVSVPTSIVRNEDDLMEAFEVYTKDGYEGAMVRNSAGKYEQGRRSYGLQKVKEMLDADFDIVGFEEGRGKLQGCVAAFICSLPDGRTFKAKPRGELESLKRYFEDHSLWTGRKLVVKYQNLSADGVPRFPIGVRFRDSVDF